MSDDYYTSAEGLVRARCNGYGSFGRFMPAMIRGEQFGLPSQEYPEVYHRAKWWHESKERCNTEN